MQSDYDFGDTFILATLNATAVYTGGSVDHLTLVANAGLFGKVYFPRLIVPLSSVISNFIPLALQLATFLAFWAYFAKRPRLYGLASGAAARVLALLGSGKGRFRVDADAMQERHDLAENAAVRQCHDQRFGAAAGRLT